MVATKLPEYAPIKQSNHRALGQAFENIIRNALKYSPHQGQVTIDLDQADKEYRIRITDNGPGVPEEMLDEIFKPFFRVDKSRGDEAGGFGLGLSLAKRQIEAVGGSIRALNTTNASEYKGLSVEIVLPQ
ncbi:MAG: ATP-binding protein [Oleiphilaceae bacterium]|nr:ATP-binding protein [Oleiphilaceae bacterium]